MVNEGDRRHAAPLDRFLDYVIPGRLFVLAKGRADSIPTIPIIALSSLPTVSFGA
jgi:hypothetical protein